MVMVTRSARRRACMDYSDSCKVLPWCSSGKCNGSRNREQRVISSESLEAGSQISLPSLAYWGSNYPSRDNSRHCNYRKQKYKHKESKSKTKSSGNVALVWVIVILIGFVVLWKITEKAKHETSLSVSTPDSTSVTVDEECCFKMKQLAAALSRAEQIIKNTRRQHFMMLTIQTKRIPSLDHIRAYRIPHGTATKGSDTVEWSGRAALWGIVPLWTTSPHAQTILADRTPIPGDCWPISGSSGEVVIVFPQRVKVKQLSVEHIKPDAVRSAPKRFAFYGIENNGTWVKALTDEYSYEGPAKQYFTLASKMEFKSVVFRVISNQGNPKYTCVYRVHVYGDKF